MTDALAKLLIEKGVITDAEFKQKLLEERAVYQRILNPITQLKSTHLLIALHGRVWAFGLNFRCIWRGCEVARLGRASRRVTDPS